MLPSIILHNSLSSNFRCNILHVARVSDSESETSSFPLHLDKYTIFILPFLQLAWYYCPVIRRMYLQLPLYVYVLRLRYLWYLLLIVAKIITFISSANRTFILISLFIQIIFAVFLCLFKVAVVYVLFCVFM